jgi:hypothetical protein
MQTKLLIASFCIIWLAIPQFSWAQLNTLAGYTNAQANFPVMDNIISGFNLTNTRRTEDMPNLRNMNGMELGLRYRVPYYGVEANWTNKFARLRDRVLKSDSTSFQHTVFYKVQSFSIGNEFYYKWFGVGGTIDYNQIRMRRERSDDSKRLDVLRKDYFSSQIFLNFEFTFNDILAFSIRPYVQMPWLAVDFFDAEKGMNPDRSATANPDDFRQRPLYYGIRLIFVNGARNEVSR